MGEEKNGKKHFSKKINKTKAQKNVGRSAKAAIQDQKHVSEKQNISFMNSKLSSS